MVSGTTISLRHQAGQAAGDALIAAMALVDRFARSQALEVPAAQRLAIVVEEIVSNLIDHAAHGREITFALTLDQDEAGPHILLDDDSDPFDPRAAPLPDSPNPVRGGGVGLALVDAWCDIVAYDSAQGRNRLILRLR
ncbi:ATP-binding protein [Novosphingobium sp. JCM 18896]|uniref:ATP-binding protein n=1 Tax=Novosphingobium sp. JCM 18896 TaxID=2989731 RepID=UPI0022226D3B|nr:ATP-binding protein [Novosphingobium sp. JCM 18896]MCW1429467.1 ATP-binding protein [Novosphingobium sp. JCM 18896]